MITDSYYTFLKNYISQHPEDFIASHETNGINTPAKIQATGLRVSHSPYGKKIRHVKDENGKIDLERAFMATMYVIDDKSLENDKFYFQNPTAPVIINIPKNLLAIVDISKTNEDAHQFFCGYGYEERPSENERCGKITLISPEDSDKANVRILPSFLIAGYFNPETEEFVENDKHFSKLSKKEQEQIIQNFKLKYELTTQNQPQ